MSMRQRSQSTKKYRPSAAKRLNGRRAPGSSEESTHKVGRHGRSIAFCDRTWVCEWCCWMNTANINYVLNDSRAGDFYHQPRGAETPFNSDEVYEPLNEPWIFTYKLQKTKRKISVVSFKEIGSFSNFLSRRFSAEQRIDPATSKTKRCFWTKPVR